MPKRHTWFLTAPGLRIAASAVLAALGLSICFPHPSEWDPNHIHVVVGGTPLEQARALVHHLAHYSGLTDQATSPDVGLPAPASHQRCLATKDGEVRVMSIGSGAAGAASVFGIGGAMIRAALVDRLPPPQAFRLLTAHVFLFRPEFASVAIDPPPRLVA